MYVSLRVSSPAQPPRRYRFDSASGALRLGRAHCDLLLDYPTVSRLHALLYEVGDTLRVRDLDSRHGIHFQGGKIADEELKVNDTFRIGVFSITVLEYVPTETAAPTLPDSEEFVLEESTAVTANWMRSKGYRL